MASRLGDSKWGWEIQNGLGRFEGGLEDPKRGCKIQSVVRRSQVEKKFQSGVGRFEVWVKRIKVGDEDSKDHGK